MSPRLPAVAGHFYPAEPTRCREALDRCLRSVESGTPHRVLGGIAPHAGWTCSGAVAAAVVSAIARSRQPRTVVMFGAVHVRSGPLATVYPHGAWKTPMGLIEIDETLAARISERTDLVEPDANVHAAEHSIEVIVPFVQRLLPNAKLLPIMTPPTAEAHDVGSHVARVCRDAGADVVFIGSTDLTHYGPSYGFTPQGVGETALAWARDVNDRRMIDLMLSLRAEDAVDEARHSRNACGPGAIAATLAACREAGATSATLLRHTNSFEVLRERLNEPPTDAVGYAGIVFA